MKQHRRSLVAVVLWSSGILVPSGCSSPEAEKPPVATARTAAHTNVTTRPGVAGGLTEDTVVVEAAVSMVDLTMHRVTLRGQDGQLVTYDVSPEIQDISRLQAGDKVTATLSRRTWIEVRRDNLPASEAYEKTWGASAPGEMPGRLTAKESTKVARITDIDPVKRTAELEFTDRKVRIPVRSDVDLSQYRVGDNVIVRVTSKLSVLTK